METKKIAIIGGGPGGLMLALLLQRSGKDVVVYERQVASHPIIQGGSLDIHEETGQLALHAANLHAAFLQKARFEGEDFRLLNKKGHVFLEEIVDEHVEGTRPEIDRGDLRQLLLDALDTSCIQYGYQLLRCEELSNGQIALHFNDARSAIADVVIGADGAFSRVRPLVTSTDITYAGITMLELTIEQAATNYPELAAFNRRGKMFALDDGKAIIGQLNGNGSIKVYASLRVQKDWLHSCGIPFHSLAEAKEAILALFHDWDEPLQQYIRHAAGSITPRRIYRLPTPIAWHHHPSATLIGDAAHVMSPFAGEGVNLALYDAYQLATAIAENGDDIAAAIAQYEQAMFAYATEAANMSQANVELCFGDNAAQQLTTLMEQLQAQ